MNKKIIFSMIFLASLSYSRESICKKNMDPKDFFNSKIALMAYDDTPGWGGVAYSKRLYISGEVCLGHRGANTNDPNATTFITTKISQIEGSILKNLIKLHKRAFKPKNQDKKLIRTAAAPCDVGTKYLRLKIGTGLTTFISTQDCDSVYKFKQEDLSYSEKELLNFYEALFPLL